jgi:hypothetical protein
MLPSEAFLFHNAAYAKTHPLAIDATSFVFGITACSSFDSWLINEGTSSKQI